MFVLTSRIPAIWPWPPFPKFAMRCPLDMEFERDGRQKEHDLIRKPVASRGPIPGGPLRIVLWAADELSPRFSCRQFCRCAQTQHSRARAFASAGSSPRPFASSIPTPDRAAMTFRLRSNPQRRMASRHRADLASARSRGGARPDPALPRRRGGAEPRWRVAHLSRLPADRPKSPARAGSFDRLRTRTGSATALAATLRGDRRAKALRIDGWTRCGAYVPPTERRGLVLIDPPFEEAADFTHLPICSRRPTENGQPASTCLWYPIKDRDAPDALARRLRKLSVPKLLRSELTLGPPPRRGRLLRLRA